MEKIKQYCESKMIKVDMRYNKMQHQYGDTECGVYSISFILRILDGETFDKITAKRIPDDEVKQCRKIYFRTS